MMGPNGDQPKCSWSKSKKYCFATDYNDHFETPLKAYEDILPLLDLMAPESSVEDDKHVLKGRAGCSSTRKDHVLYDPYYCNGRTKILLNQLGFSSAINEERDFYQDILNKTCPPHHTLITNPPYSADHKKRCIQYALQGLRKPQSENGESNSPSFLRPYCPFFLLMPNYVATKNYYKELISTTFVDEKAPKDVVYVVPEFPYEYEHPEGTGHSIPPFDSLWFCGIGSDYVQRAVKLYENRKKCKVKIATSLEELAMMGVISFGNRPNPRKRRGRRNMINEASTRPNMPSLTRNDDCHRRPSIIEENEKSSKLDRRKERKVMRGTKSINIGCTIDINAKTSLEGSKARQFSTEQSNSYACDRAEKKIQEEAKQIRAKSKYRDDNGVRKRKRF